MSDDFDIDSLSNQQLRVLGKQYFGIDDATKTKDLLKGMLTQVGGGGYSFSYKTSASSDLIDLNVNSLEALENTLSITKKNANATGYKGDILHDLANSKLSTGKQIDTINALNRHGNLTSNEIETIIGLDKDYNSFDEVTEKSNETIRQNNADVSYSYKEAAAKRENRLSQPLDFIQLTNQAAIKKFGLGDKLEINNRGQLQNKDGATFTEEESKKLGTMSKWIYKQNNVSDSAKDFALTGMGRVMGWSEEQLTNAVSDTVNGTQNKNYNIQQARDLMNVKSKKDADAFMKKYNIENTKENRERLSQQRKDLQLLQKQGSVYNKMRAEGKSEEEIKNNSAALQETYAKNDT